MRTMEACPTLSALWIRGSPTRANIPNFIGITGGSDPDGLGATSFVGYTQSHDEVGNRGDGARFVSLVGQDKAALATALAITAPHVPMLFMGEEYGEDNPFYFFHDFQDKRLVNAVQRGTQAGTEGVWIHGISAPGPQRKSF